MAFNVEQFRNHFSGQNEVAKSDRFDVFMTIPQKVAIGTGYGIQELSLQCEVSELPGRDINLIEYRHYAFTKRIPHMNQYGHTTFTFLCTGNLVEKQIFDRWLDLMIPVQTGLVAYPLDDNNNSNYESDIQINQYDAIGDLIYTVNLIDAMPTSVSPMTLDWNNDMIHRLSVSFAYPKWTTDQTIYGSGQTPSLDGIQTNFNNPIPPNFTPAAPSGIGLSISVPGIGTISTGLNLNNI